MAVYRAFRGPSPLGHTLQGVDHREGSSVPVPSPPIPARTARVIALTPAGAQPHKLPSILHASRYVSQALPLTIAILVIRKGAGGWGVGLVHSEDC